MSKIGVYCILQLKGLKMLKYLLFMGHEWYECNEWQQFSSPFPYSLSPLPRPTMLKYEGVCEKTGASFSNVGEKPQQLSSCLDLAKRFARSKIFISKKSKFPFAPLYTEVDVDWNYSCNKRTFFFLCLHSSTFLSLLFTTFLVVFLPNCSFYFTWSVCA